MNKATKSKKVRGKNRNKRRRCSTCKTVLPIERKDTLCTICRRDYNQREEVKLKKQVWREEHPTYESDRWKARTTKESVYIHRARAVALYAGGTKDPARKGLHIKGQTHLGIEPRGWKRMGLTNILSIDVTPFIRKRKNLRLADRNYIERLIILRENPLINGHQPPDISPLLTEKRMRKLEYIVEHKLTDWQEIPVIIRGNKVVNYKDIIAK